MLPLGLTQKVMVGTHCWKFRLNPTVCTPYLGESVSKSVTYERSHPLWGVSGQSMESPRQCRRQQQPTKGRYCFASCQFPYCVSVIDRECGAVSEGGF